MSKAKTFTCFSVLLSSLIGCSALAQNKGNCEFTITSLPSDSTGSEKADANSTRVSKSQAAGLSMYWMSKDLLEKRLIEFISFEDEFANSSDAKRQAEAKRRLVSGDRRIAQLSITCTGLNILSISRPWDAKEPTIPFAPGRYPIHVSEQSSPRTFSAILSARDKPPTTAYYVSEIGSIEIQRFDASGANGSFSFVGEDKTKTSRIKVGGTFDVPCKGDLCR